MQASYKKQSVMGSDVIEDNIVAIELGKLYIKIMKNESKINFDEYESLKAELISKKDIWKVDLIKKIRYPVHDSKVDIRKITFTVYLKKDDGALLYYTDNIIK